MSDDIDDINEVSCATIPDDYSKSNLLNMPQVIADENLQLEDLFKRHFQELEVLNL